MGEERDTFTWNKTEVDDDIMDRSGSGSRNGLGDVLTDGDGESISSSISERRPRDAPVHSLGSVGGIGGILHHAPSVALAQHGRSSLPPSMASSLAGSLSEGSSMPPMGERGSCDAERDQTSRRPENPVALQLLSMSLHQVRMNL